MDTCVVNMYKSVPKTKWYSTYTEGTTFNLYCGRPSIFGNPINEGTHEYKIERHEKYWNSLTNDSEPKKTLLSILGGKGIEKLNLICFCFPRQCHCDIIKEWIGGQDDIKDN